MLEDSHVDHVLYGGGPSSTFAKNRSVVDKQTRIVTIPKAVVGYGAADVEGPGDS